MYSKVLVPLDGSKEAEGVFSMIKGELDPAGQVVLFHVIPPAKTQTVGTQVFLASEREEAERTKALSYLQGVLKRVGGDISRWRPEVAVAESVSQAIVDYARRESVDLIAMYTHDRKGLAALIKGSIAKDVQRKAPIQVKVFKPQELITAG